jgi:hypothetical protein
MEGAARQVQRQMDLAIVGAWHSEAFARTKRLNKLSSYLSKDQPSPRSNHAQALAFFHGLKARGVPVKISKREIN